MPDGIDAPVHRMQPTAGYAVIDRSAAEPERHQLSTRNDTVLASGELGELPVTPEGSMPTWATSAIHFMVDVAQVRDWPEDDG
jgi:hypothetical protein